MVSEVRTQEVSIPAGTPIASPQVSSIAFPSRVVRSVTIRFPPGPSGEVGVALTMDGDAVIPIIPGEWIIGDNEPIHWDLSGYPDTGNWELTAYNTGAYPHTIYLRWGLDPLPQPDEASLQPIPAAVLSGTVGG